MTSISLDFMILYPHTRMSWFGLFTRKKPLTSQGPNSSSTAFLSNMNMRNNPVVVSSNVQQKMNRYISSYKKRNLNSYIQTKGQLRNFVKQNPTVASSYVEQRLSRSSSDTSGLSQEDLDEMKEELFRNNLAGGRKRRGNRNRKTRRSKRRATRKSKRRSYH